MKKGEKKLRKRFMKEEENGGKLVEKMERPQGRVAEAGRKRVRSEEEERCKKGGRKEKPLMNNKTKRRKRIYEEGTKKGKNQKTRRSRY